MHKIQRVLISVTDKTGVVEFALELSEMGAELISTGGTARLLREAGYPTATVDVIRTAQEALEQTSHWIVTRDG